MAPLPEGEQAEEQSEEAFYEEHRAELLEALQEGRVRLEARGEGGVGLLNQGATCYMNSLLQALFKTPEFRDVLYRWRFDPAVHGDPARCIPFQLQRLFAQLQLTNVSAVSTKPLTAAFGFSDAESREQHDVQELCRVLFDALGRSASELEQELDRLYSGSTTYFLRSTEKAADGSVPESRRSEKFLDLQVPIEGCKTLEEALQKMVEVEVLDGDNQWFCEELGKKVTAEKGMSFAVLPDILCMQLLRFVFDLTTMRRRKLTEALSVPLQADLSFLLGAPGSGQAVYALTALCCHSGTAHGGHYHAFLREGPGSAWRDANDATVRVVGPDQEKGLFPPREVVTDGGVLQGPHAASSSDAYFLVYRKVSSAVPQVPDEAVPEPHRSELLQENVRRARLQRAYEVHKQLMEVKVYAPIAPQIALRRYVSQRLHHLLGEDDEEARSLREPPAVFLNVNKSKSVASVQESAVAAFLAQAEKEDEPWPWAMSLSLNEQGKGSRTRLRLYEWSTGEAGRPLDEDKPLGEAMGASGTKFVLEVRSFGEEFEAWEADSHRVVVVRWDQAKKALGLQHRDAVALRLPPSRTVKEAAPAPVATEPEEEGLRHGILEHETEEELLFGSARIPGALDEADLRAQQARSDAFAEVQAETAHLLGAYKQRLQERKKGFKEAPACFDEEAGNAPSSSLSSDEEEPRHGILEHEKEGELPSGSACMPGQALGEADSEQVQVKVDKDQDVKALVEASVAELEDQVRAERLQRAHMQQKLQELENMLEKEAPTCFDEEAMPALFDDPPAPSAPPEDTSPSVGAIRKAAATAFGVDASMLALVVMIGKCAGQALEDDEQSFWQAQCGPSDVLCAEVLPSVGAKAESAALYERVVNTAVVSFNHPDRPEYTEEFKVSVSKDATLAELKGKIAEELGLDAKKLHLARANKAPQLKDEEKTLRNAGLAECGHFFVGHGAPCAADESLLRLALYQPAEKGGGGAKARDAFSLAAKGASSVKALREALVEPLLRWGEEVHATEGKSPFVMEGLQWKRLRIRDGQAGKQFGILRDDRTLRSALLGLADGRQVAVQVLDHDEELTPDDLVLHLRPWRYETGSLFAATEWVFRKTRSVAELRQELTARFRGILEGPEADGEGAEANEDAEKAAPSKDRLELAALPSGGPPLTIKRCAALKWAESGLNALGDEELAQPVSAIPEVRDGATVVLRSANRAASGPPAEAAKGAGKGPTVAPKAKAKAVLPLKDSAAPAARMTVAAAPRRERALVIEVAHPEATKAPEPSAEGAPAT